MSAAAPLTAKELEEIEEYEKIVKFAEDVRAGRHPGIKPKLPLQPTASPLTTRCAPLASGSFPGARAAVDINFWANYYADLGVDVTVDSGAIDRGYMHKIKTFAPFSVLGKAMWESKSKNQRDRARKQYDNAVKAYKVLSDPVLRKEYDVGRTKVLSAASAGAKCTKSSFDKRLRGSSNTLPRRGRGRRS
ncbi:hypothetical protein BDZ45DRAFT_753607 [Acephala macrosclerotiorum]|nr:hypothetical protein BDZ45DRAFT_753607 [Acephala macrosclerotiorum]